MAEKFLLSMALEESGFNEVHKAECIYVPNKNYEVIGEFFATSSAVVAAKLKHPYRKIKGCYYCFGKS